MRRAGLPRPSSLRGGGGGRQAAQVTGSQKINIEFDGIIHIRFSTAPTLGQMDHRVTCDRERSRIDSEELNVEHQRRRRRNGSGTRLTVGKIAWDRQFGFGSCFHQL